MVDGSEEAPCGRQVGGQGQGRHGGQALVGTGRVGELDGDGVDAALWYVVVQLLNGTLGFIPLVKTNEPHTLGQACNTVTASYDAHLPYVRSCSRLAGCTLSQQ